MTKEFLDEVPKHLLFANNIILIDEIRECLRKKLDNKGNTIENKSLKLIAQR